MSEYRWPIRKCWIGVERDDKLLGVIRRSGIVQALGHFCFVAVSVCGKKYHASGAEDRIYPFHSIKLKEGDKVPELELEYLGWGKDHNTPVFKDKAGKVVQIVKAGVATDNTAPVPEDIWPEVAHEG